MREVLLSLGPKAKGKVFVDARNTVRRCFLKTLETAKIRGFRFHDLPTLQNILGHASSRMTQRYAHLSKGHLASEMQVFAAAMPRSGGDRGDVPRIAYHPAPSPAD